MMTPYHTKYFAYELTRRYSADSLEKLAGTLVSAQVEPIPHQVEAALFAFQSPLSKGAILADEVGLGKTIEAGLVISQKRAEKKRRVLVITPANLRKQWHQELQEKFFLPCRILEAKSYNAAIKNGNHRPFDCEDVVIICSYQFARGKQSEVSSTPWDLVVIDEAHRLRNVYKTSSVIANALKQALSKAPKILLTATPLQNSLLELYGLVSFVDEHRFGDLKSFREQFSNLNNQKVFDTLKERLKPICKRTLRQDVLAYVSYTERHPLVQPFTPGESEDRLYNLVSDYLRRDNLQALPPSQRSLMTLVLRKLLASSTFAIAGALDTLSKRLRAKLQSRPETKRLDEEFDEDYEALDEIADEWGEEDEEDALTRDDRQAIEKEIADLETLRELAFSITQNAKGQSLLIALERAFAEAERLGAKQKAIIFTESRRTQDYLCRVLDGSPWRDGIVLFNGSNNDPGSKKIYKEWVERHKGTDRVTGSPTADIRSALVDYFRDQGQIMIATEAGAEGINLQFCSLVVNYDLPWNPQRIEQRIGRCHRYGQRHDVVVVNFLNRKNEADQRVFDLLSEKFKLFEGVFGASDEVLGAIESGVDFERRIAEIYQRCRTPEEINASFDQLQQELKAQINESITRARRQLLENFDDEVREKLRLSQQTSEDYLNRYERMLMRLSRYELNGHAEFISDSSFRLNSSPFANGIPTGLYELPRRSGEAHLYRLNHPLAEKLIQQAKDRPLSPAVVAFDYEGRDGRISRLEDRKGEAGSMRLSLLTVESLDQIENYTICVGARDDGQAADEEALCKLFQLPAQSVEPLTAPIPPMHMDALEELTKSRQDQIRRDVSERNARFYEQEAIKLDAWADDQKVTLERDIKELDRQIKEARRASTVALTLEEKLDAQKRIRALETERNQRRRALFDAQDDIDRRRSELITEIEGKLKQKVRLEELFSIRWRLV
jgi:ERCC4-related helicase